MNTTTPTAGRAPTQRGSPPRPPQLRVREERRRRARIHLFTYLVGNALFWILWGAISVSTDNWYWWPIIPLGGWAAVLTLHLWHVYGVPASVDAHRPTASTPGMTPRAGLDMQTQGTLWKYFVAGAGRRLQLLWRYRLGWLFGHSLLVLTTVGRRSGNEHRTVLYVQRYDRRSREATVVSVWGESRWLRNIRAHPAVRVEIGLQRYVPEQRFLTAEELFAIERRFRRRHRIIAWGQAKLMGWLWPTTDEQLYALSAQLRGVTFRPMPSLTSKARSVPLEAR
jgi:deazaflavin-dependent oxidoreductase (nitroreductase family)